MNILIVQMINFFLDIIKKVIINVLTVGIILFLIYYFIIRNFIS